MNIMPEFLESPVLVMVPSQFFQSLGVMVRVTASSRPSGLVSLPGLVPSALSITTVLLISIICQLHCL